MTAPFGKVIFKKGDRTKQGGAPQPFTYLFFEEVMDAFLAIRKANTGGYQYESYWNRPLKQPNNLGDHGVKGTTCALVPYVVQKPTGGTQEWGMDPAFRSNCSSSTVNAVAIALSHGDKKTTGTGAQAKTWAVPLLGGAVMPLKFYSRWQLWADLIGNPNEPEWWHGAQRSITTYNLGDSVRGDLVRRGDVVQLSWNDWTAATPIQKTDADGNKLTDENGDPVMETQTEATDRVKGKGHSVFAYHVRKVSNQETRFLIISSQPDTFGVGVRMNGWSLSGLPCPREWARISGAVKQINIDHQETFADGFESPEFVKHALTHGLWYLASDIDDAGSAKGKSGFFRAHVARPRRPFPCFPIAVKKLRTPAFLRHKDLTAGPAAGEVQGTPDFTEAKDAFAAYYDNNEQGDDGFFPIGAGRTWHTGVHLHPDDDKYVYAPLDGRVVCARLAPPDKDKWAHGSGNFVLLKHALEIDGTVQELYTLVMHLEQPTPETDAAKADGRLAFPWLRDVVLALAPDAPEYKKLDPTKLHLQIKKLPSNGVTFASGTPIQVGDIFELDPDEKISGKPVGIRAWSKVDSFASAHATRVANGTGAGSPPAEGDMKKGVVNWNSFEAEDVVVFDGYPKKLADRKKSLDAGDVVDFWDDEIYVGAGERLGRIGTVNGVEGIHFEVFSASFIKCWTDKPFCDSPDPKMFADRKTFADKFWKALGEFKAELKGLEHHIMDSGAHKDDKSITRSEIVSFYKENADRYHFRDLVVRCPSAWSEAAKWHEFDRNAKSSFGWLTDALLKEKKEKIDPYVWWKKSLKSAGLPSDMTVVHYHPIRFLEWINELREKEAGGSDDKLHVSVYEKNHLAAPGGP